MRHTTSASHPGETGRPDPRIARVAGDRAAVDPVRQGTRALEGLVAKEIGRLRGGLSWRALALPAQLTFARAVAPLPRGLVFR
jgi:hypothetical protein